MIDISEYRKIRKAEDIETVICMAVLIAHGILPPAAELDHALEYYDNITDCGDCPCFDRCLACIINE
jgi:hypothetical protein